MRFDAIYRKYRLQSIIIEHAQSMKFIPANQFNAEDDEQCGVQSTDTIN